MNDATPEVLCDRCGFPTSKGYSHLTCGEREDATKILWWECDGCLITAPSGAMQASLRHHCGGSWQPIYAAPSLASGERAPDDAGKPVGKESSVAPSAVQTRYDGGLASPAQQATARDSERLIWMAANDASFGTSGNYGGEQAGKAVWHESRFVRVPCRHLYEWHCYDGADWREAIDNAMEAEPCREDPKRGCVNTKFAPLELDHPLSQALRESEAKVAALTAAGAQLRKALEEATPLITMATGYGSPDFQRRCREWFIAYGLVPIPETKRDA